MLTKELKCKGAHKADFVHNILYSRIQAHVINPERFTAQEIRNGASLIGLYPHNDAYYGGIRREYTCYKVDALRTVPAVPGCPGTDTYELLRSNITGKGAFILVEIDGQPVKGEIVFFESSISATTAIIEHAGISIPA